MTNHKQDDAGRHYVDRVRQDTQRYTQELLQETQALRCLVASLEAEKRCLAEQIQSIRLEAERFNREQAELQQRLAEIQDETRHFARQFVEVERQNSNLANLYVASYQLHGTLERERVLGVIQEILSNLVGTEETAVFELDQEDGSLRLVSSNGIDRDAFARVVLGEGLIGRSAASGETWIAGDGGAAGVPEQRLTACVPLKLEDRVTGAIATFRLLPQKSGLDDCDRELFGLLATHAAMALYCTGLHRKLAP